ncbi:uncharacterized protein DUF2637 [Murinocardiopsis flavida]|uniref:Uncharacterized protein DUF2637 n=1 Tax=Murinocardiopsis flavida TaxID=645275 RepID=A0A2P8CDK3_9ACTN|nr:DUF2637 domain-containing protein [Murinocardiopsis flavida]PSK83055.1 uncharacterized protein DUF2637 [Murinocardiopsis flavida]
MITTLTTAVGVLADPPWWLIAALALVAAYLGQRWLKTRIARLVADRTMLTGAHVVITAAVLTAALALITLAFAMSYAALYEAATWLEHTPFGDLRWMFPIGIDAVIVFFLALDLVMEWQGRRHPLARYSAYLLSAVTIVLNISQTAHGAGAGDYLGHAGPPLVIILISEAVAAWIRHVAGMVHGDLPERIPAGRMLAHPVSTLKVARLMLGWGITSYEEALRLEKARQLAIAVLRQQYGRAWRSKTPRNVLWMLNNGYDLAMAFELVDALTPNVPKTRDQAEAEQVPAARDGRAPVSPTGLAHPEGPAAADPEDGSPSPFADAVEDFLRTRGDTPGDTRPEGVPSQGGGLALLDPPGPSTPGEDPGAGAAGDGIPGEGTPGGQGEGHATPESGTSEDVSEPLLGRARAELAAAPRLSVRKLADRLGCSKSHADRLRKQIREGTPGGTPESR